jgi:hypothetical protein
MSLDDIFHFTPAPSMPMCGVSQSRKCRDNSTTKHRKLRKLAGRLEALKNKTVARSMPQLCADLMTAAGELPLLFRVPEVARGPALLTSSPIPSVRSRRRCRR